MGYSGKVVSETQKAAERGRQKAVINAIGRGRRPQLQKLRTSLNANELKLRLATVSTGADCLCVTLTSVAEVEASPAAAAALQSANPTKEPFRLEHFGYDLHPQDLIVVTFQQPFRFSFLRLLESGDEHEVTLDA